MTADTSEPDGLRVFAATTLGSGIGIDDRSRTFGRKSVTWRIRSGDGTGFYLKRHEFRHHYEAEVRALNTWVSRLSPGSWWAAPEVVATSKELGAVILTELPGEIIEDSPPGAGELRAAYSHAGRLARSLHDADIDLSDEPREQVYTPDAVERHFAGSRTHLDPSTCDWAEAILTAPDAWDGLEIVPMHGDYSPRNWIIQGGDPTLKVIDWERSRPGYWVEDIQRMTHDHWLDDTHLRDAFFEGYGRTPTHAEWRHANQITLVNAIGGVGWAISHGDMQFAEHNRKTIERLKELL
ncbi:MAG: aminoglycoside phosphotransferase family protein [Dehalococcoidia bacterium]|jgi:aminoglycoside phosphotransferase (APT) family kinase protein|nr:aminoglycoside phosphotransferase family protein [Dehalococcoidia bacterium]